MLSVITLLVPAIAQVNNNISVGSTLFATNKNSAWTSPSGNFAFGFHWLPGEQDQFLLAVWFAKIPDETLVWFAKRDNQKLTRQLVLKAPSRLELWRSNNSENREVSNGAMLDTGNFVMTSTN